jgi:putative ABC transport system permease protein
MVMLRRLISGFRRLIHKKRFEHELDGELRAFLETATERKVSAGMSRADAARAARVEIGSFEAVKDGARDVGWESLIEAFWQDMRYAARLLQRNPLFALTAALSLAVGIGATTTIFTVINGLLLRAAPGVSDPDRLVDISRTERGQPISNPLISYRTYLDLQERVSTLDALYAQQGQPEPMVMGKGGNAERIFATIVTGSYFDVLGVLPAAGRLFVRGDSEERGASPIVVLSHGFWKRRFNADPSIVGQTLQLNGEPFTVVGVASEEFRGTSVVALDVWVPLGAKAFDNGFFTSRMLEWGLVGGRRKPGVSTAQVAAELDAIGRALAADYPNESRGRGFLVANASPIPPSMRLVAAGFFALLMALVSLVLIMTCANVAGILLARAAARRREIAVRIAIGAGRARVVRQLLTETLLLFLLGGGAGLLFARGMTSLLIKLLPAFEVPVALSLPLDGRVLAFALGLSLAAAVLSGLAPALHVSKADVVTGLKDESQGPSDRLRVRNAFVVAQVAFGIVLVITAGVLGRAMGRVVSIDQGFDSRGVEAASFDLSQAGYTEATGSILARELADRLRKMSGVEAVALADQVPFGGMAVGPLIAPGVSPPDGRPFLGAWNIVDTGYFETLRIPLVAGRDFNDSDRAGTQPVAIIADAGARRLWPGQDPIGRQIQWQTPGPEGPGTITTLEVIGVARDLRFVTRGGGAPPIVVYVPLQQRYTPHITILARMAEQQHATPAIAAVIRSMNANLPPATALPLDDQSGPVQVQLRVAASVAGSVGLVALLLAAMGIYGVTAYTVARRTREIGIRIAMGARPADIVRLVLGHGMSLVVIGCVIGVTLAAAASRLLTRLVFGASPLDPMAFGGAVLLFVLIGLAACYMPVRRATQIDAMEALRYE